MSKDFESEVPVRCTMFVDVSNSVRVGHPGPTPLSRLVELAAAIAQTAVANRDPVGMCVFDERSSRVLSPAANQRQVIRIMNQLAAAAGRPLDPVDSPVEELVLQAYVFCREVYPELLHPKVNRAPFRIFPLRPLRRRQRRRRVQMATLLAEYYRLDMGAPVRLSYDDSFMAEWLQRFLGEHHIGYEGPLHDRQGRYLFSSPEKIGVLAQTLIRSVGHGRDNELFILMVDLLELGDRLSPLLTAIKVALARHHRVIVLCPWPPGLELPKNQRVSPTGFSWSRPQRKVERTQSADSALLPASGALGEMGNFVYQMDLDHYRQAFEALRSTLARLRVPVICAAETQSANVVLAQLEQLRLGRITR